MRSVLLTAMAAALGIAHAADSTIPLSSRYVPGAEGVPINVVESGPDEAPTLILLHGFGQSHLSWTFQLQSSLARNYHLVALDLRGHGNSGKPWQESSYVAPCVWAEDVRRVIAASAKGPVWLVGWSFGTWVAVDYLTCFGHQGLAGVVLVGGLGGLVPPKAPEDAEARRQFRERSEQKLSGVLMDNFAVSEEVERLLIHGQVPEVWRARVTATNVLLPPYARALALKRSFDHQGDIGALSLPVLLVAAEYDIVAPVAQVKSLAIRLPRASFQVIEGAGHTMMAEQPDTFNRIILEFLRNTRADDPKHDPPQH